MSDPTSRGSAGAPVRRVVIAHPSPDRYGADLQMLETVSALLAADWAVTVTVPADGPLVPLLVQRGADVAILRYPAVRKSGLTPTGLVRLAAEAVAGLVRGVRLLRRLRPEVVLVNTVTLPWWTLAGRLVGLPVVVHLHEAETDGSRLVRQLLIAPVRLATAVIVISRSALAAMVDVAPGLQARAHLIYNGVPQPPTEPATPTFDGPLRALVVGRLSPRKAPHIALDAVGAARRAGVEVTVTLAGSVFPGYEWYEDELRARAARDDLAGAVTFAGYRSPIWPDLATTDLVLAPSLREPFGNAVVEAQLSARPVVATAALGHLESIEDGVTGLLVPAEDVTAMADAIARLAAEPALARSLANQGRTSATQRFSVQRYRRDVVALVEQVSRRSGAR